VILEMYCPVEIDSLPPLRFFDGVSRLLCEQPLPKDPEKVGNTGLAIWPGSCMDSVPHPTLIRKTKAGER